MDEVVNAFKRRPSTHDLIKDPRYSMNVVVSPTIVDDSSSDEEDQERFVKNIQLRSSKSLKIGKSKS